MTITAQITINNSKNLTEGLHKMLVKSTYGIPLDLVEGITANLNNRSNWKNRPSTSLPSNAKLTIDQAVNVLADSMRNPSRIAFRTYVALLIAMDKLLSSPGITVSRKPISLNKSITLNIETDVGRLLKRINIVGEWAGLAPLTMKQKVTIGATSFYRHTGEASAAFHAEVVNRLASLSPRSFVKDITKPITSDIKNGNLKFARFSYKVGTPSWNPQMDQIITTPFATGKINQIGNVASRLRHLYGVERIVAAEATRPILRQLAAKAGCELQAKLTGKQPKSVLMQRITQIRLKKAAPDVQDLPNMKMLWLNRHK